FPKQITRWNVSRVNTAATKARKKARESSRNFRVTAAPPSAKIVDSGWRPAGYVLHQVMYEPATHQHHIGYIKGKGNRTEDGQQKKNEIPNSCPVATCRHGRKAE